MKFYIISYESVFNFENSKPLTENILFDNLAKAKERLKGLLLEGIDEFTSFDSVTVNEDGNSFEIYVEGRYAENHISASIIETNFELSNMPLEYWKQEAKYQMEEALSDECDHLAEEEKEEIATEVAYEILDDDYVWQNINDSLDYSIREKVEKDYPRNEEEE